MGPEARAERLLTTLVERAGGQCLKLAPIVAGTPDRLVLLPGGVTHLVELKSEVGSRRRVQRTWHRRSAKIGHHVVVLRGEDHVRDWVASLDTAADRVV